MTVEHYAKPVMAEIGGALGYVHVAVAAPPGADEVVLCLHDMVGRGQDFAPLAPLLAARGTKVLMPDLPGRGASARLPAPLYGFPGYLESLATILRDHPSRRVTLLGSGWGGSLALTLAAMWRPQVHRLVLCDLPLSWSFGADPVARAWADVARLRAPTPEALGLEARAIFAQAEPDCDDLVQALRARCKMAEGLCGLDADPALFDAFRADPARRYAVGDLLSACRTETVLLQGRRAAMRQPLADLAARLRPGSFAAPVAATSFLDLSDPAAALPILGAVLG